MTLVDLLETSARRFPSRTALVFGSKNVSYLQCSDTVMRLARGLRELGVHKGDKVALWLPNCPEFVYSFFAIVRLGAVVVPINTMFKREEALFIVEDSGTKVLICSIDKIDDCKSMFSRVRSLEHLVSLPAAQGETVHDFNKLAQNREPLRESGVSTDDLAEIVYTSGTTGRPKGATLTHRNLVSNVHDCARVITLGPRDCLLCILPLFHSFSSTVCMLMPLSCGARMVIMRSVRPFKRVMRAIFKQRVTILPGVPSVFSILAEVKLSRLRWLLNVLLNPIRLCISGAAALPEPVWEKFEKKFRRRLLQGYGLTEASPVVSLNPVRDRSKPGSIGLPLPSVSVKVVDADGHDLTRGKVGELLVKGPNVMQGYYNRQEDTRQAIRDGWLFTGDLARIDEEGFIYIMGRLKEMINVRGFNVYPREIEDLLYKYPHVKECAVVGVTHRHRGEVPVVFIVTDARLSQSDILGYLRTNLAAYKVPLKVIFKESLPKNPTGKILKLALTEEVKDIFQ